MQVTDRDRELLGFLAEHRLVLSEHVQALLGVSATAANARLHSLSAAGMVRRERVFHHQPACYQITRKGLAVIGSALPQPRIDLRCYAHDVGLAWLWLAARDGAFGQLTETISERAMRSRDGTPDGRDRPFGVRLGGTSRDGRDRLHYPDLLLTGAEGWRIALELELSSKGRFRQEKILAGYGIDHRIDAVLYLVEEERLARSIRASARRLGISDRIHVQPVCWQGRAPGLGRTALRTAQRVRALEA